MTFQEFCANLETKIIASYEEGVTLEQAEHLGSELLAVKMRVSEYIKKTGLDVRMRKRGFKSIKSKIRTDEIKRHDKKPTEGQLEDLVNLDPLCQEEERLLDEAIEDKEEAERLFGVFKEAHINYRGIGRGKFE